MTFGQAVSIATAELRQAAKDPRREALDLLVTATGQTHAQILTDLQQTLSESASLRFRKFIDQRCAGVPFAYVVSNQPFCGLSLYVNRHTLIPRPATEFLVEAVLDDYLDTPPRNCLDIGVGSGAIAIALAVSRRHWQISGSDISTSALAVAARNARHYGTAIRFRHGRFAEPFKRETFDIIVANLPYLPTSQVGTAALRYEPPPALDGGRAGLDVIRTFISTLATPPREALYLECLPTQVKTLARVIGEIWPQTKLKEISNPKTTIGLRVSFANT